MKTFLVLLVSVGAAHADSIPTAPTIRMSTLSVEASTRTSALTASSYTWRAVSNNVFLRDENFTYVVKWGVVTAGYSTLSVKGVEIINGRPAYHLVSQAKSSGMVSAFYKVEDRNEAWLDEQAMVSVRFEKRIQEGKYHVEETTLIDQPRQRFHLQSYRLDRNSYEQKQGDVPPNVLDVLGSLYYIRLLPLEVGLTYTIDVLSGEKVYPLEVRVKKRETITVPGGKFDTFRVEPLLRAPGIFVAKGKKLEVWLTADARRIPVRMRSEVYIGHVSAELLPYSSSLPSNFQ